MTGDVSSSGFSFDGSTSTVSAGAFVVGQRYKITTIGTTDFTAIGASNNTQGLIFTATGVGTGNGTATTSTSKSFNTSISENFITTKTEVSTANLSDEILIYRSGSGLRKISKANLLTKLQVVPIGSIFPFAGPAYAVPSGYLLCDGSEKSIGLYPDLYDVIGFIYTPDPSALRGVQTFKLPDLRGRFPLGLDNMDNGDSIPDASAIPPGSVRIDSGGGPANRVTDATASTLGNAAGIEQITMTVSQMPQHKHTLLGDSGTQFYATNNSSTVPTDTNSTLGNGPTASNQGQYLKTTGNIDTSATVGRPINLMNPYLAINYIIFTGAYL
jgi:microcystin-dependent protein